MNTVKETIYRAKQNDFYVRLYEDAAGIWMEDYFFDKEKGIPDFFSNWADATDFVQKLIAKWDKPDVVLSDPHYQKCGAWENITVCNFCLFALTEKAIFRLTAYLHQNTDFDTGWGCSDIAGEHIRVSRMGDTLYIKIRKEVADLAEFVKSTIPLTYLSLVTPELEEEILAEAMRDSSLQLLFAAQGKLPANSSFEVISKEIERLEKGLISSMHTAFERCKKIAVDTIGNCMNKFSVTVQLPGKVHRGFVITADTPEQMLCILSKHFHLGMAGTISYAQILLPEDILTDTGGNNYGR